MGFFEKLEFYFWDATGMVEDIVKDWKPVNCTTEKAYEKSLYAFFHKRLEDIQITKQYAKGRIHADLVVGDRVIIELKNNLNTTAKYQRLIGQLSEYKEWEGEIVLILTGETDPNIRKQLNKYIEKEVDVFGEGMMIIEKNSEQTKNKDTKR